MDLAQINQLIQQLGFPIFVSCYLMIRMDKLLRDIRDEVRAHNKRG